MPGDGPIRATIFSLCMAAVLVGSVHGGMSHDPDREPRIMPLGDSITAGGLGSYRRHLGELLRANGRTFDFVGSRSSGPMADNQHEGHNGWWPQHLVEGHPRDIDHGTLHAWLPTAEPDIVLLHIGSNGLSDDMLAYDPAMTGFGRQVADVRTVLDVLYAHNPDMQVLVATIIGRRDPGEADTWIAEFNRQLEGMVQAYGQPEQLHLVAMQGLLDHRPDYFSDAAHPSASGHDLMAQAWFPVLDGVIAGSQATLNDVPLPAGLGLLLSGLSLLALARFGRLRRTAEPA